MATNKMKEDQNKIVRIWVDPGVVIPRTTTYFPVPGGHSPGSTTKRAMDGSMGGIDAQGSGQPVDVLVAQVL